MHRERKQTENRDETFKWHFRNDTVNKPLPKGGKIMRTKRITSGLVSIALAILVLGGVASNAIAAGTASGTTISNQATIDFNVNSIAQPQQSSNNYQFVVDNKVDLTVSTDDGSAVLVTPGSNDNVLTFTVQNDGNTSQDFQVTAAASTGGAAAFGGTDNIDADTVEVFVESGATAGYQAGEDTATHIDALAADTNVKVYIVSDFNTGYSDGDIASYYLVAEARINDAAGTLGGALTQTAGADTVGSVDIVFADGDGDGGLGNDASRDAKHSSQDDYEVSASSITFTKSSTVISDPFNNTTNPKRIPGAVIEYNLTISNAAGASTATDISIADSLNTEIATNGTLAFNTQYDATAGQGIVISHPDYLAGADTEYTNANDGAEFGGVSADWSVTTTNTVTVNGITLDAGESAAVKFRVTVQ